jgi:hypothetical protein
LKEILLTSQKKPGQRVQPEERESILTQYSIRPVKNPMIPQVGPIQNKQ